MKVYTNCTDKIHKQILTTKAGFWFSEPLGRWSWGLWACVDGSTEKKVTHDTCPFETYLLHGDDLGIPATSSAS